MSAERQLPEGWRWVTFGEVAHEVSESTRTPIEDGFERYVGLEHFEPDSLSLKRWGMIEEDNPTFTKVFRVGQLLFGRRRAYQRKASIAGFDGICSGDIIVIEALPEFLLPDLLPFIVQSDGFWDNAIHTSAGSLSPRTKWANLAAYEFPLPPLDEQRRIAEILWAVENAIEEWLSSLDSLIICRGRLLAKRVLEHRGQNANSIEDVVLDIQYGSSVAAFDTGQFPILRIPNVVNGQMDLADLKWVDLPQVEVERYALRLDDVLLVRTNGNPDYVGRAAVVDKRVPENCVFASYLIRLKVNTERMRSRFLVEIINSPQFRRGMRGEIKSSAGNYNLNTKGIRRQSIVVPPLEYQDEALRQLDVLDGQRTKIEENIDKLRQMKNQLFATYIGEA